jgi:hypothetical protein
VISLGGAGVLSSFKEDNNNIFGFLPKEKKTKTQQYIYTRRDTEDGPLEIIPPTK